MTAWRTDLDTLLAPTSITALKKPPPPPTQPLCHGRVTDLSEMVPAQWWKTVFADSMYLRTDGDVVEDPDITREEIAMLEQDEGVMRVLLKGSENGAEDAQDMNGVAKGKRLGR